MRLFVLAGGFGTRLKPVVSDVPKPLAPVESLPFLGYLLKNWVEHGIRSFVFLLHYKASQIKDFVVGLEDTLLKDCEVRFVYEESRPLGTGGAIANAVETLGVNGMFMIANADTWVENGSAILRSCVTQSILVCRVPDAGRFGSVTIDDSGYVTRFEEKKSGNTKIWVYSGMAIVDASNFREWDGRPFSLEQTFFPGLVASRCLKAEKSEGAFVDIGVPEDYAKFSETIGTLN